MSNTSPVASVVSSTSSGRTLPVNSDSEEFPSIEIERGNRMGPPMFLRPSPQHSPLIPQREEPSSPDSSVFPFLEQFQVSLDIRGREPGCGINQHDIFDDPVRCDPGPSIEPKPATFTHSEVEDLFDQFDNDQGLESYYGRKKFVQEHYQRHQYSRSNRLQQRPRIHPGLRNFLANKCYDIENPLPPQSIWSSYRDPSSPSSVFSSSSSLSSISSIAPLHQHSRFQPQGTYILSQAPLHGRTLGSTSPEARTDKDDLSQITSPQKTLSSGHDPSTQIFTGQPNHVLRPSATFTSSVGSLFYPQAVSTPVPSPLRGTTPPPSWGNDISLQPTLQRENDAVNQSPTSSGENQEHLRESPVFGWSNFPRTPAAISDQPTESTSSP